MKQVAIFDDCYDNSEELEKVVNKWIKEENINVIDIRTQPVNMGYIIEDCFHYKTNKPIKSVDNTIYWTITVIYEE